MEMNKLSMFTASSVEQLVRNEEKIMPFGEIYSLDLEIFQIIATKS